MDIEELIQKVNNMLDLNNYDIDTVSSNLFVAFNLLQNKYDENSAKLVKVISVLEKSEKEQLNKLKFEEDFVLSNRGEYDTFLKGEKTINKLNKMRRNIENELNSLENYIKMVMNMNFTIKNIIDYQNFKNGVK